MEGVEELVESVRYRTPVSLVTSEGRSAPPRGVPRIGPVSLNTLEGRSAPPHRVRRMGPDGPPARIYREIIRVSVTSYWNGLVTSN